MAAGAVAASSVRKAEVRGLARLLAIPFALAVAVPFLPTLANGFLE